MSRCATRVRHGRRRGTTTSCADLLTMITSLNRYEMQAWQLTLTGQPEDQKLIDDRVDI